MMAKARMRKEGATELLTLDPPADYIIANGLDRLLPTDLLQLAHNDQRSTDGPVSYTHLRAHETPEHLVCRLLLENKKPQPLPIYCTSSLLKLHNYYNTYTQYVCT
eukprot:TRINITY_DN35227_c0_g1_i1.p1 TRINITY_DN35227_c0_g1~~TRINITY_DN35227_c0_g1_i1.p1  ORF type:complete len:106 (-),score=13.14 TRINITY_DN35227_c0_g1_i1:2-319(-)